MELFSNKYGHKPVKSIIQVNGMDSDLRKSLWNAFDRHYWRNEESNQYYSSNARNLYLLSLTLWEDYFKNIVDEIPNLTKALKAALQEYFFKCEWFEVYDFIQFVANNYRLTDSNTNFIDSCNSMLKQEVSGYRFIGTTIAPITSEQEIAEIEETLTSKDSLPPVTIHIQSALNFLSDKESPDYRNSIKESISAVEAMCRAISGSGATLGKALSAIQSKGKIDLHGALKKAFKELYGYTSDEKGIRHSLLEEPDLDFEDAKFMLVSCSAFINYLKVKVSKGRD